MYFESKHEKNIAPNHCDPDRIDPLQLSVRHRIARRRHRTPTPNRQILRG